MVVVCGERWDGWRKKKEVTKKRNNESWMNLEWIYCLLSLKCALNSQIVAESWLNNKTHHHQNIIIAWKINEEWSESKTEQVRRFSKRKTRKQQQDIEVKKDKVKIISSSECSTYCNNSFMNSFDWKEYQKSIFITVILHNNYIIHK